MIKIAGISIAVLLALLYVTGLRLDTAKAEARLAKKEALENWAKAESLQKSLDTERANAAEVAKIETQRLETIAYVQAENARLIAADIAGRVELRVKATCPKHLPETTTTDPRNDASAPELTADARQAYHDLRAQHAAITAQVVALQGFARLCSNSSRP